MQRQRLATEPQFSKPLPLDPDMPAQEMLRTLRMNALLAHQISMGRGDELVLLLKRAIRHMESTHLRIQYMSITLFLVGLIVMVVGVVLVASGSGGDTWTALGLGSAGGLTSLVAAFWTAPLEKMSRSISDLVKLEAAFLGYIRVIGELDSAFQWQYLENLAGSAKVSLDQVINDTTSQVKDVMTHVMQLIDKHVSANRTEKSKVEEKRPA